MKQKLNIRQKMTVRLGTTLEYTAAGMAVAGMVVGILFTFNFLGNNKDAMAETRASSTILLFPDGGDGKVNPNTREAQPVVTVSSTTDSLYIEFVTSAEEPIKSAVLRLKDYDSETSAQTRVMTLQSPEKVTGKSYRFAVPVATLPEKLRIEASTKLANKSAEQERGAWSSEFNYDVKKSAVSLVPSNVKATNVTSRTATACWNTLDNAYKYRVKCRATGAAEWRTGLVTAPGNQRPLMNLQPNTTYEVKVQAYTRNGKVDSSGYSRTYTFTTPAQ